MRKTDSFYSFEELIYQESLRQGKEKLFLTNGRFFMDIGINGNSKGIDIDLEKESEFLEQSHGIFVYSYHTHITKSYLKEHPEPPSFSDFCSERCFRERAKKKGKKIVSRVIEKNGVWQYSHNSLLPPAINLDEMIENEIMIGSSLNERVKRLIKGYDDFGVSSIKFSKRKFS
ncbi:hypothetical protein GOV14_03085 [Candidatus Pacearchaeota archaeon]|nr:hypothetical protein [Candidatus Pacearchaeota archaeon]